MQARIAKTIRQAAATLGALACTMTLLAAPARAADEGATLTITSGTHQRSWTRDALLRDGRIADVTVQDENLKRSFTMKAIPLAVLLQGMPATVDGTATTAATDGYVSHLPMRQLLADSPTQPRAWLAVENPAAPWPPVRGGPIGPFRLVWTVPAGQPAVNESLWTYAIAKIDITGSPGERFPAIRPAAGLPADGPVMRGFATFQRVCFSCHTVNQAGDTHLGPDLNVPYNPVEYLGDDKLAKLIRDPQSLRWWPDAKMPPIGTQTLSDAEMKDLVAYLRHMAGRKQVKH